MYKTIDIKREIFKRILKKYLIKLSEDKTKKSTKYNKQN